jgi:hypothetical protein
MKALGLVLLGSVLLIGTGATPAEKAPAKVKSVTVLIRNRVFHEFFDKQTVAMNEEFQVGDSEYTAELFEYIPDFAIDTKSKKVLSRSNEPNNPAFHVVVREKGAPTDTVWAFLNTPPHFARKSMLAFKIHEIEFIDRAKITAPPEPKNPASQPACARQPPASVSQAPSPGCGPPWRPPWGPRIPSWSQRSSLYPFRSRHRILPG